MHGGDIYRNKIQLDFSVSINPLGMSESIRRVVSENMQVLEQYPDQKCEKLKLALADKLKISASQILFGNGASELIPAVLRALKVRRALMFAPCFVGYKRAFLSLIEAAESPVEFSFFNLSWQTQFKLNDKLLEELDNCLELKRPDIFIVTNPNNPDGSVKPLPQMEVLAKLCRKHGTKLLIDECFMELSDNAKTDTFVPLLAEYPEVMVLRAFTKTFAVPGLRLGYLLSADERLLEKVEMQLAEWNVSSIAQCAGLAALQDEAYLERARNLIKQERLFLCDELKKLGFKVFGSSGNFLLFYSEETRLKEKLIEKGILIRDCSDYEGLKKGFYRISIKKHAENQKLIECIQEVCEAK